jgi:hypothetical protein
MVWPTRGTEGAAGSLRVRPAIAAAPVSAVAARTAASANNWRLLGVLSRLLTTAATWFLSHRFRSPRPSRHRIYQPIVAAQALRHIRNGPRRRCGFPVAA